MDFLNRYKYIILIFFISVVVYSGWFSFYIFSFSDYIFVFSERLKEISLFWIWDSSGLGSVNLSAWCLAAGSGSLAYGLFGYLGFDSNIADKFLLMWPWIILSGLSSYLLVKKVTQSDVGAFIGALVFSFSTYFISSNRAGHLLLPVAFIFAVFTIYFFIRLLEEKKLYLAVITALFLFITASYDFRSLYITVWILFFYALYFFIFLDNQKWSYKNTLKRVILFGSPLLIFFLLSLFWLWPSFQTGTLTDNAVLARSLFGSNFFHITRSFTLFHPFWTGSSIDWFIVQPIPFYFWLIPIFVFFGLVLNRKNKYIVFFGGLALVGVFLAKQVGAPFGGSYKWLFQNLIGFSAFREASKFYFLISLSYAVLIGAFAAWLWDNWKQKKWQVYCGRALIFLIAVIFIWNGKSIVTGEIGSMFVSRHIPHDYLVFNEFILKDSERFRVLWIPRDSKWGIYINQKLKISGTSVLSKEWAPLLAKYNQEVYYVQERIINIFNFSFSNNLLDSSSIKYVIIPIQDIANDDDFFIHYGGRTDPNIRDWYIAELDKISWLNKIDIGTEELVIYENPNYRPHIYLTDEIETIYKETEYREVEHEFKNPTEYKVSLRNLSEPLYLNFSESYYPDWKIRVGDFNWFEVLYRKDYFLPDGYHFKNDAMLSSFHLDPEVICGRYDCVRNSDGSYNIDLTLYFRPQSYFYLGLIISATTLLGCFGYLGYDFIRRRRRREEEGENEEQ